MASTPGTDPASPARPGASDQPAGGPDAGRSPTAPAAPMAPGDEAPPGTPGTGENLCPACGGSGRQEDSATGRSGECPECLGTGRVTVGIGGA